MMIGGVALALVFSVGGLAAGWALDLPAGAVVVVIAGAVFLAVAAGASLRRMKRKAK